jgi:hypothetical protein
MLGIETFVQHGDDHAEEHGLSQSNLSQRIYHQVFGGYWGLEASG